MAGAQIDPNLSLNQHQGQALSFIFILALTHEISGELFIYLFKSIYLFIWLGWVFVAAHRISVAARGIFVAACGI